MNASPAPATGVARPVVPPPWDPALPRPPRYRAAWLGVLIMLGTLGWMANGLRNALDHRYAARPDACSAVDLTALTTPPGTAQAVPSEPASNDAEVRCSFQLTGPAAGTVAGVGSVTITVFDTAAAARIVYETRRSDAEQTEEQQAEAQHSHPTDVAGVGQRAYARLDESGRGRARCQLTAQDSNLLVKLEVATVAADGGWTAERTQQCFATLASAVRAALPKLA